MPLPPLPRSTSREKRDFRYRAEHLTSCIPCGRHPSQTNRRPYSRYGRSSIRWTALEIFTNIIYTTLASLRLAALKFPLIPGGMGVWRGLSCSLWFVRQAFSPHRISLRVVLSRHTARQTSSCYYGVSGSIPHTTISPASFTAPAKRPDFLMLHPQGYHFVLSLSRSPLLRCPPSLPVRWPESFTDPVSSLMYLPSTTCLLLCAAIVRVSVDRPSRSVVGHVMTSRLRILSAFCGFHGPFTILNAYSVSCLCRAVTSMRHAPKTFAVLGEVSHCFNLKSRT